MMPTPLDLIYAAKAAGDTRAELDKAATQTIETAVSLTDAVAVFTNQYAALCAKLGRDTIRSRIVDLYGEATAAAIDAETAALKTMWEAVSPYPFPELSAQPVPEPTV
jgi:hypothetical protein